jgi:MraZ protein
MYRLTGEYDCKIDVKGRVRLPGSLIKQLGDGGASELTVNRGFEKHLILYPKDVWEKKTTEINQLNIYNVKQRQAIRYFYRGATAITLDSVDRILIPKSLLEYADIEKEVVLFAYQEQIEIWSKSKYEQMLGEEPEDFSELANEVFFGQQGSKSDQNE